MAEQTEHTQQHSTMQDYIVTARKWRPQRFMDVVGQDHVSTTLRNAVLTGRIHHAYMFNGPRGVGKTTSARVLAKAVNCPHLSHEGEPCGVCESCVEITAGRSYDVIEIDGASNNSVDDIRTLRENAKYPPTTGKYKLYIIDEVHMLSTSAFNALLKILEEPPKHLLFVFATTEPHKVPATILSRCQRFDFRRMQIEEIAHHLRMIATAEQITADDESLVIIAKKGDGSMRDSQSIFDQAVAFCGMNLDYQHVNEALNLIDTEFFFTVSHAIRTHDVASMLSIARDVFMRGYDMQECLLGLAEHFRNILTVKATGTTDLIELAQSQKVLYRQEAEYFIQADVLRLLSLVMITEKDLRSSPQPRLRFEFALVQMAQLDSTIEIGAIIQELRAWKKKGNTADTGTANTTPQRQIETRSASAPTASQTRPSAPSKDRQTSTNATVSDPKTSYDVPSAHQQSSTDSTMLPASNKSALQQHTMQAISGDALQQGWDHFCTSAPLSDILKNYLTSGLFDISFTDATIHIDSLQPVLAANLYDHRTELTTQAQAYFHGDIRIMLNGQEKNSSISSSTKGFTAGKKEVSKTDSTNQSGISTPKSHTPIPPKSEGNSPLAVSSVELKDVHPLDQAILQHFQAVEISLR